MPRIDSRVTRRSLLLAFLAMQFGTRRSDRLRLAGARFTTLAETEIDWLFRWCSFDRAAVGRRLVAAITESYRFQNSTGRP